MSNEARTELSAEVASNVQMRVLGTCSEKPESIQKYSCIFTARK